MVHQVTVARIYSVMIIVVANLLSVAVFLCSQFFLLAVPLSEERKLSEYYLQGSGIGNGGFGSVYAGTCKTTGKSVSCVETSIYACVGMFGRLCLRWLGYFVLYSNLPILFFVCCGLRCNSDDVIVDPKRRSVMDAS